eukprot:scaffold3274_cov244-Pinguiococcus_pyrenoidosus.AAC.5
MATPSWAAWGSGRCQASSSAPRPCRRRRCRASRPRGASFSCCWRCWCSGVGEGLQELTYEDARRGHTVFCSRDGTPHVFGRPFDVRNIFRLNNINNYVPLLARLSGMVHRNVASDGELALTPVAIPLPADETDSIRAVAASVGYTLLVTEAGAVYTFGSNIWGQCGVGSDELHVWSPTQLQLHDEPLLVREVACGFQHTVARPLRGPGVVTWGKGERYGDEEREVGSGSVGPRVRQHRGDVAGDGAQARVRDGATRRGRTGLLRCCDAGAWLEKKACACATRGGPGARPSASLLQAEITRQTFHNPAPQGEGGSANNKIWLWGKQQGLRVRKRSRLDANEVFELFEDAPAPRLVDLPDGAHPMPHAGDEHWFAASGFHMAWTGQDGAIWMMGMKHPSREQVHAPVQVLPKEARLPLAKDVYAWLAHQDAGGKEAFEWTPGRAAEDFEDTIVAIKPAVRETLLFTAQGNAWRLRYADELPLQVGLQAGQGTAAAQEVKALIERRILLPKYLSEPPEGVDPSEGAGFVTSVRPLNESFLRWLLGQRGEEVRWANGKIAEVHSGLKHSVILVEGSRRGLSKASSLQRRSWCLFRASVCVPVSSAVPPARSLSRALGIIKNALFGLSLSGFGRLLGGAHGDSCWREVLGHGLLVHLVQEVVEQVVHLPLHLHLPIDPSGRHGVWHVGHEDAGKHEEDPALKAQVDEPLHLVLAVAGESLVEVRQVRRLLDDDVRLVAKGAQAL